MTELSQSTETRAQPRIEHRVDPGHARAARGAAGELVEIEDLEGCQCSDLLAFHAERTGDGLSMAVTRATCDAAFPLPGQAYVDAAGAPLLTAFRVLA